MKIRFFEDTDTLLIERKPGSVAETRDLDESKLLKSFGTARGHRGPAARYARQRLCAHRPQPSATAGERSLNTNSLTAEREHQASLLEAVQRCAHSRHASSSKVGWPLDGSGLKQNYETDYALIAEHFNELQTLRPVPVGAASRLLAVCGQSLGVSPTTPDFEAEFQRACAAITSNLP